MTMRRVRLDVVARRRPPHALRSGLGSGGPARMKSASLELLRVAPLLRLASATIPAAVP
jgi:hypothetical protein